MFFTKEDIDKIYKALGKLSIKDSEFKKTDVADINDTLTIIQGEENRKINLKDFFNSISLFKKEGFLNITERFNRPNISLIQAITLVPIHQRIDGLVITFQDINNDWRIYQFRGNSSEFINEDKWLDLYDYTNYIVKSIVPDEEDLTVSKPDKNGNSVVSLKDKVYDESNFSGKGYKILRKNIQLIDGIRKNVLTQDMINEPNTIYEIRYDFDLENLNISLLENSRFKFAGGHLKYGDIVIDNDILYSKEIGMIPNIDNYKVSTSNYKKLMNFINLGFHIIIDDTYYIHTTSDTITTNNLAITGIGKVSKLFCKNFDNGIFVIKNNINEITIKNITIDTDVSLNRSNIFVNIKQSGPLFIKNINIENCNSRNIRIFSYFGEDIDMSKGNTGIHNINVRNCNINETVMYFVATDVPIDCIHIEHVNVTNLYGPLFQLATTNEYVNQSSKFCDKLIVNNCLVENTYIFEDEVSYLSFIVAEFRNIYYHDNIIKNIISTNPETVSYDAYLVCNNLWYYNNVVENILCANERYGDIFKCKMIVEEDKSSIRYICGNYYKVNDNYLKNKKIDYLFINSVGSLQHYVDFFYFNNNIIEIPSPYKLSPGNFIKSKYVEFCNNNITAPLCNDIGTSFILVDETSANSDYKIIIRGNTIESINTDTPTTTLIRGFDYQSNSAKPIFIENNIIKGCTIDYYYYRNSFNVKNIVIKNNTLIKPFSNILDFSNCTLIVDNTYITINNVVDSNITIINTEVRFPENFKYAIIKFTFEDKNYKFFINLNDEKYKFIISSEDTIKKSNDNIYLRLNTSLQLYIKSNNLGLASSGTDYIKNLNATFYTKEPNHNIFISCGNFEDRPTNAPIGFGYFCNDRKTPEGNTDGMMIYNKGKNIWVDSLGRVVI